MISLSKKFQKSQFQKTRKVVEKIRLEMIVAPVVLRPSFSFPAEDDASKFAKKDEESEKKKLQSVVRGDVLQCSSSSSGFAIYLSSSIVMMMAS